MAPQQSFRGADSRPAGPVLTAGSRHWAARYRGRPRAVWAAWPGRWRCWEWRCWSPGYCPSNMPQPRRGTWARFPPPGLRPPTSPGQPGQAQAGVASISAVWGGSGLRPPLAAAGAAATPALPYSRPVSVAIPAIGVNTNLIELGLGPGHTLQVPPLTQAGAQEAGWYDLGPAPGQLGPAVIAGHVDSDDGPGAFFRLGALRPGDRINVTRADGTVALFRVDAVDDYSKDSFPTQQVYGPVSYAGLRVITCGGSFNFQTHHYLSNIVIYATLTGSRPRTTERAGHSRA